MTIGETNRPVATLPVRGNAAAKTWQGRKFVGVHGLCRLFAFSKHKLIALYIRVIARKRQLAMLPQIEKMLRLHIEAFRFGQCEVDVSRLNRQHLVGNGAANDLTRIACWVPKNKTEVIR